MYKIRGADGKDYGPVDAVQLRLWIAERRANAQTLIQSEGSDAWKPLSEFPEFSDDTPPAAAVPAPSFNAPNVQPAYVSASAVAGPKTNGMAIAALVLGILSIPCCGAIGVFFAVLALVFAGIAISQINRNPELHTGKGLAISGIVLAGFGIILGIIMTIFYVTGGLQDLLKDLLK